MLLYSAEYTCFLAQGPPSRGPLPTIIVLAPLNSDTIQVGEITAGLHLQLRNY